MPLPTPAQVQALLSVTFTEEQILSAIADAELILGPCGDAYPENRRNAIIKYVAAHLLSSTQAGTQGNIRSESVDGTSYSFASGTLGSGLDGSSYGQQARLLDINECLPSGTKTAVKMVSL